MENLKLSITKGASSWDGPRFLEVSKGGTVHTKEDTKEEEELDRAKEEEEVEEIKEEPKEEEEEPKVEEIEEPKEEPEPIIPITLNIIIEAMEESPEPPPPVEDVVPAPTQTLTDEEKAALDEKILKLKKKVK